MKVNLKPVRQILFYAGLLVLWQLVAASHLWASYILPTPKAVFQALVDGVKDKTIFVHTAVSMKRLLIGYALSVLFGFVLGIALAYNRYINELVGPLVGSLQSLPSTCWVPMALLWFGLSDNAIIFVVVMGSLFSITISVETTLRNIPKIYPMAGRNLGARGLKLFFLVLLPATMPNLLAGLKQGWAFAWRSLIGGEMLVSLLGLGQLLNTGRDLLDINLVFAVMVLIIAIGFATDALFFRIAEHRVREKWGLNPAAA